jgi:hypothetical protein
MDDLGDEEAEEVVERVRSITRTFSDFEVFKEIVDDTVGLVDGEHSDGQDGAAEAACARALQSGVASPWPGRVLNPPGGRCRLSMIRAR